MVEVWKKLYGHKTYLISNQGNVKSVGRKVSIGVRNGVEYFRDMPGKLLATRTNNIEPFYFLTIYFKNNKDVRVNKTIYVHRAVADHFVKKPGRLLEMEICGAHLYATHIEKDYTNNRMDNLKFISHKELIGSQPKRIAHPTKSWETRRTLYGPSGSKQKSAE